MPKGYEIMAYFFVESNILVHRSYINQESKTLLDNTDNSFMYTFTQIVHTIGVKLYYIKCSTYWVVLHTERYRKRFPLSIRK